MGSSSWQKWLICKLAIALDLQRRSPFEERYSLICVHMTTHLHLTCFKVMICCLWNPLPNLIHFHSYPTPFPKVLAKDQRNKQKKHPHNDKSEIVIALMQTRGYQEGGAYPVQCVHNQPPPLSQASKYLQWPNPQMPLLWFRVQWWTKRCSPLLVSPVYKPLLNKLRTPWCWVTIGNAHKVTRYCSITNARDKAVPHESLPSHRVQCWTGF